MKYVRIADERECSPSRQAERRYSLLERELEAQHG